MAENSQPRDDRPVTIYSVGHSNHALTIFLDLLKRHGIESLVDVRSAPYSRYVSHFNRVELEEAVERQGIRYVYLGDELGGRPAGDEFYDEQDHVLYSRVARAPFFLHGIERLIDEGAMYRMAIMCSEEDPAGCHRHLLIARVLETQGVQVRHIRSDDREQTEEDLKPAPTLWGAELSSDEEAEWKSIRSVSRRRPPSNSSSRSDAWESDDF